MHAERARAGRLPEAVVLEHAGAAVAHQLGGDAPGPLAEHLRGDDVVRPPAVADLPRAVLGVAAGLPVDLVGLDARGVLAREEPVEALAQHLDRGVRDEPLLDDQEAVAVEGLAPARRKAFSDRREHRAVSQNSCR